MNILITKHEKGLLALFIILAIVGSLYSIEKKKIADALEKQRLERIEKELRVERGIADALSTAEIIAKSFSVYDLDNDKRLYGRNDNVKMPLASLAKTMTVMVALDQGVVQLVEITPDFLKAEGEYNLIEGEIWNVKDLARFALIFSSNDAAVALSRGDQDFVKKMNDKSQAIGLTNTEFSNPTGLDTSDTTVGAYGTANEANKLAAFAISNYGEVFESTVWPEVKIKSESGYIHDVLNTNLIIDKIPSILFSKTGYTDLAGGNLTIIFKNAYGHRLAITVLGSTMQGRFIDMEKIVSALYNLDYEI